MLQKTKDKLLNLGSAKNSLNYFHNSNTKRDKTETFQKFINIKLFTDLTRS